MISRRVAINLAVFFVVAILLVLYGVLNLFGNPLAHHDVMTVRFSSAGGLHPNFLVSLDGVPVGEVSSIKLEPGKGVKVSLKIDTGKKIPSDVRARIIRSSAVGEQRVDLLPLHGGNAPPLPNHAVIQAANRDSIPPDVNVVVARVNRLLEAIPTTPLNSLIHETSVGIAGRADDLRSIIDSLTTLSQQFLRHQNEFRTLVTTSPTILNGVADEGDALHQALANTKVITKLLVDRRYDLVHLFDNGTRLGRVGSRVILANRANLTCIFSDLADTAQFFQGSNLQNFSEGLRLNQYFFGPVDKIAPYGYVKDPLTGEIRHDQTWLRTLVLLPPGQPPAISYHPALAVPPTKPGAACRNVYGNGVGPVSQGSNYKLLYGAKLIPPTAAEAAAPPAARTGPASVNGHATPASLSGSRGADGGGRGGSVTITLLVLLGAGLLVLGGVAVPYRRYYRRG